MYGAGSLHSNQKHTHTDTHTGTHRQARTHPRTKIIPHVESASAQRGWDGVRRGLPERSLQRATGGVRGGFLKVFEKDEQAEKRTERKKGEKEKVL